MKSVVHYADAWRLTLMKILGATDQPSPARGGFKKPTPIGLGIASATRQMLSGKFFRSSGFAAAAGLVICGMTPFAFGAQSPSPKPEPAAQSPATTNQPPQPALVWAQLPTTLKFSHATHADYVACSECHVLKHKNPYPDMAKCNECHDEVKAKEGSKECLMCHTSNDDYTAVYAKDGRNPDPCNPGYWGVNAKLPGVIRQNFEHLRHFDHQKPLLEKAVREEPDATRRASLEKELKGFPDSQCILCHPQIKKSKKAGDDNFPTRSDCGRCHEVHAPNHNPNDVTGTGGLLARQYARPCAVCHKGARPGWDNWNGRWVYPDGTPIKCQMKK
jgi:hypothetical protein